jgi:PAS domain S-box-containing protein
LSPAEPKQTSLWLATIGLAVVVLLCGAAAAAYMQALHWIDHTLEVRETIDAWRVAVHAAEAHAERALESGNAGDVAAFRDALAVERAKARNLEGLVSDNPTQVANVAAGAREAAALLGVFSELVAGQPALAMQGLALRRSDLMRRGDRIDELTHAMVAHESELLVQRRVVARNRVLLTLFAASALSVLAGGLMLSLWNSGKRRRELLDRAASEARERMAVLSDIAVALSEARATKEVAGAVVDVGMKSLGADTCTLYLLDQDGTTLELIGDRGVAPEIVAKIRKMSASEGNPVAFQTLRTGAIIWAENEADYERLYPRLAHMKVEGPRAKAFWSVPLIVEGRAVGLLGMGFYRPRHFSSEDRMLVDTLSRHCAQALLRATRLESEAEAQRWFTTTLRSIGDAVIATDPEGAITFMNPVAETLTGYAEAEARGQQLDRVFAIFSEQTREPVESPVAKVLREGRVVGLANHTVLRSKSGRELPIDDSGAPIRGESGQLIGVVLVFRDVSQDKADRARRDFMSQAGEALVASLDYQETLATVARLAVPLVADWCAIQILEPGAATSYQAAVHHVDPTKVEFVKELGERYPPDPSVNRGVYQVIRTGESELYPEIPAAMLEASAKDAEHLRLLRELELCSGLVVPLKVRDRTFGAITLAYAESKRRYGEEDRDFAEDFARRAAMAIENALALRAVEEARVLEHALRSDAEVASRAKDEFLAVVSHELRTPLNAILGWTVMLRTAGAGENLERGLAVIERNARAQAKLIEDVLDVSRIISGKLSLNLGPTIVADVVNASIETVTPAAEAKGITIVSSVPSEPVTITADHQRVHQVVWNLLSNAVKFTPKGGRVSVRAALEGSDVRLEVSDSGEGIRADALPFVFEPFRQADASTTRRHGGLGLGLAIVRQLVSAHGGTVSAESEGVGKGATFSVTLPARSAVTAVVRGSSTEVARPAHAPGLPRLDGLRLLVVDDEEDALALVKRVLSAHGAEVHAAASASEALDRLGSLRPDVIVSDIGMPGEDGYSLIRRIRALPPENGGRTPAVALTAYARAEDAQRAFAAGFQIHVAKPVEPVQLANVVANLGGRTLES